MDANLEKRVLVLEQQMAYLMSRVDQSPNLPWWHQVCGMLPDDELTNEALRLGRAYRESLRPKKKVSRKKIAKSASHARH